MMLDDTGAGHVMVSTAAGPSFSMDAGKLTEMLQLLAECESPRVLLAEGPVLAAADRP